MKLKNSVTMGLLVASVMASPMLFADDATATFTDTQQKAIQKIIHDYLVNNPDVLVEASQALQQKQQEAMQQQAQSAIQENAAQLFSGNLTTVGNPKGNVTLVEFFDYQCIHCKKMSPIIRNLIKNDTNLRVIFKEFPIFGKTSEVASRAALAAAMQGQYQAMHEALIHQENPLTDDGIFKIAQGLGLDIDKLKKDMDSKTVTDILEANRTLAEKMRLMGTPAFVVGATPNGGALKPNNQPVFIPGAIDEQALGDLIKKMEQ